MAFLPPAYGGAGDNVSITNPVGTIYVKGSEFVDGSIRLVPDAAGVNVEMQQRADGVWNETGLQLNAETLHLGRELEISGSGGFLQTTNIDSGLSSLLPRIPFDNTGTEAPVSRSLSNKLIRVVVQPDESTEVIGKSIVSLVTPQLNALATQVYLKTGSVGATAPVLHTLRKGGPSGLIIWQRLHPTSVFGTPNVEIAIDFVGMIELVLSELIHASFTSDNDFSMKQNAAQTNSWTAIDFFRRGKDILLTDNFVLGNDLAVAFNNELQLVHSNPVY